MLRFLITTVTTGFFLAGTAVLAEKAAEPQVQALKIKVANGGTIVVIAQLIQEDGKAVVCGAYFFEAKTSGHIKSLGTQVLRKVYFTLDNKSLLVATDKFKRYDSLEDAEAGNQFGCYKTARPASEVKNPASFKMKLAPGNVLE